MRLAWRAVLLSSARMARRNRIHWLALALLFLAERGWALEVRETAWGFNGQVVPGRMNPVAVRIANPGNGTFDGALTLRETAGVGGHNGAPFVQPTFLSPRSERWVQFTVFISSGYEDFAVEWGRGARDRFTLPRPTVGPPARVLLGDSANPFTVGGGLKLLPDSLFPTTVAATDGLDGVVLDYAPRWEPARREAFLDWVRRGGTVLVLPAANGQFPQFPEPLAALNIAGDSARVGAGTVRHVSATRREANEALFNKQGFQTPTLEPPKQVIVYDLEQTLFQRLAQLTRPNIRWWLINSLTLLYIVVVGPVHYAWGRRLDYRVSLGGFVGCVGLFGLIFSVVGRRGYDEAQTVHSLSIARALGSGRADVTQWVSAFATRGDIYTLTHPAPSNLYAVVSNEAVNGQIFNGKDGRFVADIPLYSSRQFVHRAVMQGDDPGVTVEAWESGAELMNKLVLRTGPGFPRETVEIRARYRDHFYRLDHADGLLTIASTDRGQTFDAFLSQTTVQQAMYNFNAEAPPGDAVAKAEADLRSAVTLLYLRAMDGRSYFSHPINRGPQPPDQLQLYVFAKSPEGFRMEGKGFGREIGYVLYVQEVVKP